MEIKLIPYLKDTKYNINSKIFNIHFDIHNKNFNQKFISLNSSQEVGYFIKIWKNIFFIVK